MGRSGGRSGGFSGGGRSSAGRSSGGFSGGRRSSGGFSGGRGSSSGGGRSFTSRFNSGSGSGGGFRIDTIMPIFIGSRRKERHGAPPIAAAPSMPIQPSGQNQQPGVQQINPQPQYQQPCAGQTVPQQPVGGQPASQQSVGDQAMGTQQPYTVQPRNLRPSASGSSPAMFGKKGCGCMAAALIFAAVCIIVSLFTIISLLFNASYTVQREALPVSATIETAYYTDADGDWIHASKELEEGLKSFYEQTGVQPYVYILPNGSTTSTHELQQRAETLYGELFEDEGHFLLVFCDDGDGGFNCGYSVGSQASSVMNKEAIDTLAENLDRRYSSFTISEEKMFSKAFSDTADDIMKQGSYSYKNGFTALATGVLILAVCLGIVLIRKKREDDERKRRERDEILSRPLEKFGDQEVEVIARKYEQPLSGSQPQPPVGSDAQRH